jgi:hypothetical protein
MKNIWNQYKLPIIIIVYILAAASLVYFLAVPIIKGIEIASDQSQEKIIDHEIDRSRINQLEQMDKDWLNVEAKKDALDVILSPDSEVAFIESVESIAEKTGNTISLKIGENADPKEIEKIKKASEKKSEKEKGILDEIPYNNYFPVQINLKGSYSGLFNFTHMLENSQFYVNIITFEVQSEVVNPEESSQGSDIFSNPSSLGKKASEKSLGKKEIISANINAIVYTKK